MKLRASDRWAVIGALALALATAQGVAAQRAVPRGNSGGGGQAPSPGGSGGGSPAPQGARAPSAPRGNSGGSTAAPSGGSRATAGSGDGASSGGSDGRAVAYGRPRDGNARGVASVRTTRPPYGVAGGIPPYNNYPYYPYYSYPYYPYYPYYGAGYYPWGYGGFGFSIGFGGYYGAGYYGVSYSPGDADTYATGYADDGARIQPSAASFRQYFAGAVGDFDGTFPATTSGPHRLEFEPTGSSALLRVRVPPSRTGHSGKLKP